jgi:hypothetical protein
MGLRITVQKRIIDLFKAGTFPVVTYTGDIPEASDETLVPTVICNEVAASLLPKSGAEKGYIFGSWAFEVYCSFGKEVDVSEFLLESLRDIYNGTIPCQGECKWAFDQASSATGIGNRNGNESQS